MALAIALLPAGPRDAAAWMRMLLTGTLAGALMAVDSALDLDLTSVLYPVWQAAVAVRLAMCTGVATVGARLTTARRLGAIFSTAFMLG